MTGWLFRFKVLLNFLLTFGAAVLLLEMCEWNSWVRFLVILGSPAILLYLVFCFVWSSTIIAEPLATIHCKQSAYGRFFLADSTGLRVHEGVPIGDLIRIFSSRLFGNRRSDVWTTPTWSACSQLLDVKCSQCLLSFGNSVHSHWPGAGYQYQHSSIRISKKRCSNCHYSIRLQQQCCRPAVTSHENIRIAVQGCMESMQNNPVKYRISCLQLSTRCICCQLQSSLSLSDYFRIIGR